MFNVTVVGKEELVAKLDEIPASVMAALQAKIFGLVLKLQNHVVKDKLTGQVLNVVSGNLRRSITASMETNSDSVWGYVFSSGDVKYAALHEYGGDVNRVSSRGNAYTAHYPERSFMRSGLQDMAREIERGMISAVVNKIKAEVEGSSHE